MMMGGEVGWGEHFKCPYSFCEFVISPFCESESQTHQSCFKKFYLPNKHPYSTIFVASIR